MNISAKTEYACIAMLELAANYGSGKPVPIRAIAERHGVPDRFLVQILLELKAAGLVASTRGAAGGYRLVRPPAEVSLGQVMDVIGCSASGVEGPSASPDSPAVKVLMKAWREAVAEINETWSPQVPPLRYPSWAPAASGRAGSSRGSATACCLPWVSSLTRRTTYVRSSFSSTRPLAFTLATGRCHGEVLLRARAIENQAFLIAPNQCGRHSAELVTYGHSAIVDPWGEVLAVASGDQEEVVYAELKAERLAEIRRRLPALTHRKLT